MVEIMTPTPKNNRGIPHKPLGDFMARKLRITPAAPRNTGCQNIPAKEHNKEASNSFNPVSVLNFMGSF